MMRTWILLVAASLFCTTLSFAQVEWVESLVNDTQYGPYDVCVCDLNADGTMDVLSTGGQPHFVSPTGEDTGYVSWYNNQYGAGSDWVEQVVNDDFLGGRSVIPCDLDGDGDMDLVAGGYLNHQLMWWENLNGDAQDWTAHLIAESIESPRSIAAADLDQDGDMDLALAITDEGVAWMENVSGNGLTWSRHDVDGANGFEWCIQIVDLDDDGDLDLLRATFLEGFQWIENVDGAGQNWTIHTIQEDTEARFLVEADVDSDGDLDVVSAAESTNGVVWHENLDGSATSWTHHSLSADLINAYAVHARDVDLDGDIDLLATAYTSDQTYVVMLWDNVNGDGSEWNETRVGERDEPLRHVVTGDVDDDGDIDILATAHYDHEIVMWRQNGFSFVEERLGDNSPRGFELGQAYPNPFNSSTTVSVEILQPGRLNVTVFDVLGREVSSHNRGTVAVGHHSLSIDGSGMQSGIYFVRVSVAGNAPQLQKVVLLK